MSIRLICSKMLIGCANYTSYENIDPLALESRKRWLASPLFAGDSLRDVVETGGSVSQEESDKEVLLFLRRFANDYDCEECKKLVAVMREHVKEDRSNASKEESRAVHVS